MRVTFSPKFPSSFPHKVRVAGAFTRVAVSPTGVAYEAGHVGPEAVLQALKGAAFESVALYVTEHPDRDPQSLIQAFLDAFRLATQGPDDLAVEIIESLDLSATDERIRIVAGKIK